jgi:hypothetical protein
LFENLHITSELKLGHTLRFVKLLLLIFETYREGFNSKTKQNFEKCANARWRNA